MYNGVPERFLPTEDGAAKYPLQDGGLAGIVGPCVPGSRLAQRRCDALVVSSPAVSVSMTSMANQARTSGDLEH